MKRYYLIIASVVTLIACKQEGKKENCTDGKNEKQKVSTDISATEGKVEECFEGIPLITNNVLKKPLLVVNDLNKPTFVVQKLFPGKICGERSILWKVKTNSTFKVDEGTYEGEEKVFPAIDAINETVYEESLFYSKDNVKHCALFFSTCVTDGSVMPLRIGRFNCAVVGVVIFKQTKNDWKLVGYNPAIGCFGMFGSPNSPQLIKFNDTAYGFFITNGVAGGGGPYTSDAHFYSLDEKITKLFVDRNSERLNTSLTTWGFNVVINQNESINIVCEGYINDYDIEVDEIKELPKEYAVLIKKTGNYQFKETRKYIPNGLGGYGFKGSQFTYTSKPVENSKGNTKLKFKDYIN